LCFKRTLDLDPNRANAAFKAGGILREIGQLDEALAFSDTSSRLQPVHSLPLQLRALNLEAIWDFALLQMLTGEFRIWLAGGAKRVSIFPP